MKLLALIAGTILVLQGPLYSQDNRWRVTLSGGDVISGVELIGLMDNALVVAADSIKESVPVDSIAELRLVRTASFFHIAETGAAIGSAVGLLSGAIFSKPGGGFGSFGLGNPWVYRPLAALGTGVGLGVIGYIVGGIVAAILNIDEVYDLSHVSNTVRVAVILHIFHRGGITAEDSR